MIGSSLRARGVPSPRAGKLESGAGALAESGAVCWRRIGPTVDETALEAGAPITRSSISELPGEQAQPEMSFFRQFDGTRMAHGVQPREWAA